MAGLAITGYKYNLSTSTNNITYQPYADSYTTSNWTSGTTFTITGLTNGTYYKVKIRAVNALGEGAESAEIGPFRPNTVPSTPSAATLTAGDATDTFTWSAPASNGSTITKYAYQVSTDSGSTWYSAVDGTLNAETETANLSVALSTQYKLSSYKLRVRAFNNGSNGGWSSYSTISSSGTGAWTNATGTDTDTDTACGPAGCSETDTDTACGPAGCSDSQSQNCECGTQSRSRTRTSSRTRTRTRTSSRTRTRSTQQYTRAGSTSSSITYGEYTGYSEYSYSAWSAYSGYTEYTYSAWGEYGAYSACAGGSWAATSVGSFVYAGNTYTRFAETNSAGNATGGYYYYIDQPTDSANLCGCYEHYTYTGEYCSNSGTYRANAEGRCRYYRSTSSCGGGGK